MSEEQPPAGAPEISAMGSKAAYFEGMDSKYLEDKALMGIQINLWSGTQAITDEELQSLGITDVTAFRSDHTPGSKFLVSKKRLSEIAVAKTRLWGEISKVSSAFSFNNLRLVREDFIDDLIEKVREGERDLKEAVDNFIENHYDAEKRDFLERSMKSCPGMTEHQIMASYPSKESIRSRHRVSFVALRTPRNTAISKEVERYCRVKMEEEIKGVIEDLSESFRLMLTGSINSFRALVAEKDPDARINQRTVRRLDEALKRFQTMAPTFGDTRISAAVTECRQKLAAMEGFSKRELESSDLPSAIDGVFLAVTDEKLLESERKVFISNFIDHVDETGELLTDIPTLEVTRGISVFKGESAGEDSEIY